jgi:nitrogen PTS system EIIA component
MPHRVLNLDQVAAYLHIHKRDLEVLVKRNEIPCERQGERVVFRRRELDAWASQRILRLSGERLTDFHRVASDSVRETSTRVPIMPRLLTADRIEPALTSRTKNSALRDMVALAEKTGLVSDPRDLLESLLEREALCSTALAGGLALLHTRHHDPYLFVESFIVLGRAVQPIHCGSQDGAPTDIFFLICTQDDRTHLRTLARLCTMSDRTAMLASLRLADSARTMLDAMLASEVEVMRGL